MTTDIQILRNQVRIPNLPMGRIVDENGKATDDELTFRQALLTLLQQLAGTEGLVMPQQTTANITAIQNNRMNVPVGNTGGVNQIYTCAYGTMIYDSDLKVAKVALEDPAHSGVPKFFTVTTS